MVTVLREYSAMMFHSRLSRSNACRSGAVRASMQHARQLCFDDRFRLLRNPQHELAGARNIVNEARILTHRQRTLVNVTGLARRAEPRDGFRPVLPQRPLASGPALDEPVAPRARHRTRPDQTRGDVRNFGKLGVVPVAVDDRLLDRKSTRLN